MGGVELLCVKIGIPRSLFYYRFISFWDSFFTGLGAQIVVSDPTNKKILDDGVKACVDEACLPIKLFYGHVLNLRDKADYILIPRFTSISKKEYICPEFGGLPDMIRHTLKGLPPIIDTEVDMRNSDKGGLRAALEIGAILGVSRHTTAKAYGDSSHLFITNAFSSCKSQKGENRPRENRPRENCPRLDRPQRIAVIGHPYNIYDKYISMDLLGKLARYGLETKTIEMVNEADINTQASKLSKPMFWNYGRMAYGAALHLAATGGIDGFICVTSFGCGIDAFVNDLIERSIRKKYNIPFITMTIDEHSGEAGFNTRLEAFVDMLQWRRSNESYISAFG